MVLVWLNKVEVGSFALREAILSVKLKLSSNNRVFSPAVHVKSGFSKNEDTSIGKSVGNGTVDGTTNGTVSNRRRSTVWSSGAWVW